MQMCVIEMTSFFEGEIYSIKNRDTLCRGFFVVCVSEESIVTTLSPSPCAMRPASYFTTIFLVTDSVPEVSVQK